MFNTDPNRTTEELLADIRNASTSAFNNKSLSFVPPPFAALLVKLSREADARAQIMQDLTKEIRWLTKVIVALTIVILILTAFMVCIELYKIDDHHGNHDDASPKQQQKEPHIPTVNNITTSPSINGAKKNK